MQQLAFKAYGEVTNRTASDKQIEYALFRDITQSLQEVAKNETTPPSQWAEAIDRNLQLWTLLSVDLVSAENQLDPELKRGLLTLSETVRRISYAVLAGNPGLDELVDINETIMAGLAGRAPAPADLDEAVA